MKVRGLVCLLVCFLPVTVQAQVFVPDDNATTGEISEGDGQALYGQFGEPGGNTYGIYRKFEGGGQFPTPREIQTAEVDAGNPSSITWSGIDQGGPSNSDSGFLAPGTFIGNTNSTSSYGLMNFGAVIDGESSTGDIAEGTDDNGRRDWDIRLGFFENPDTFIDVRDPNNGSWDLWTGNWETDGIGFQFGLGANIDEDPDTGDTDYYVYPMQNQTTDPSFFAQSGDPDTLIGDQGGREVMPLTARRAGSGEEIDTLERNRVNAGADYDSRLEASWKMEEAEDGMVMFSAKLGNVIYEGLFDPGTADNPVVPNPTNDPDLEYTDGFFDWKSAVPVLYVGALNGTSQGATAQMGMFFDGDFNADGVKNDDDRAILNANLGVVDSTYSLGDLNQDGVTDAADLALFDGPACDVNGDGTCDANDIDAMTQKVIDGEATQADRTALVESPFPAGLNTWIGDSDENGQFDDQDFVKVFIEGEYLTGEKAVWIQGDWDGNFVSDDQDIVAAFIAGGYLKGQRPATAAVPEPSSLVLLALGALALIRRRR